MTIREHLEAIRDRHTGQVATPYCGYCDEGDPCPDRADAVAALRDLDNAERIYWDKARPDVIHRLVSDPVAAETPPRIDEVDFSQYQPGRGYE